MTWVPIRGAVRALREAARLEQRELAKRAGVTERTVRLLESRRAPRTMHASTVKALAGALGCTPEDLASWIARARPAAGDPDGEDEADVGAVAALPRETTLGRRAARERALGRDQETLTVGDDTLPLLGPTLLRRLHIACAAHAGDRIALRGVVREAEPIPARAAPVIDARVGEGARFLVARTVARGVPFYATVFTRALAHTTALLDAVERGGRVTLIARVVVAPPDGEWKGFFVFEKRPKPHPFALVITDVL